MKLPKVVGTIAFWVTWPGLWIYLRGSKRTRVIIVSGDRVLLVKSWLGTNDWGLPGGGRHGDESVESAGVREVQEETNIDIQSCEKQILFTDRAATEYGFSYSYSCLGVELEQTPVLKLQPSEIVEARWATASELENLKLSAITRECLAAWSH